MSISENYNRIQEGMARACAAAHRQLADVTLVAVTKFVPPERIAPAIELGIRHVGENRAQEFREKETFFTNYGCTMHFIGQLQTNKVRYVVGKAGLIQSVDRIELAQAIEQQAVKQNVSQDILLEVNIGGEAQKGGLAVGAVEGTLAELQNMPHIRVKGLMCVPPALTPEAARPYFAQMRNLFEKFKNFGGISMQHLSMGMSGDYEAAIQEGATMVRIGSALFGARDYTANIR